MSCYFEKRYYKYQWISNNLRQIQSQNKVWVCESSKLYDWSVKRFLQDNDIEIYSAHYKWKHGVAKRLVRTLKNKKERRDKSKKIWLKLQKMCIKKWHYTVDKYCNTHIS